MWELYDLLIDGVDPAARADCVCRGKWQAFVSSGDGAGLASLLLPGKIPCPDARELPEYAGLSLRSLATLSKSWDRWEAAVGVAALNAWYGRKETLRALGAQLCPPESEEGDVFRSLRDRARGKRVAVVGHFLGAASLGDAPERLLVFEREPKEGDLPDAAEEYLLPGNDLVIVTGMALTNKTLPRLLQLAGNAFTALTGPSVPMTPLLGRFGADALYGMVVWDPAGCRESILRAGDCHGIWRYVGKAVLPVSP